MQQIKPKRSKQQRKLRESNFYRDGNKHHVMSLRHPMSQVLPDTLRVEIPFTTPVAAYFNASTSAGEYAVYANSLNNISASLLGLRVYGGYDTQYKRYRVENSTIEVKITSRESAKSQFLLLTPSLDPTAITTLGTFATYQNLPWTKRSVIGPYVSGPSITTLTQSIDLEKFVGPHYRQQDEYAGQVGNLYTDPTTLVYWKIAFANPDLNTLTTGGVSMLITLRQVVTLYEPIRSSAAIN